MSKVDLEVLKSTIAEYVPTEHESAPQLVARPLELVEFDYANLLEMSLPPIKTVGNNWFAYGQGVWKKIDRATLRPKAQVILPEIIRTSRRESALLDHLEGRYQVSPDVFRGFYAFDSDAILINANNGIVRVAPGEVPVLLPSCADYCFAHKLEANFSPDTTAQQFTRILSEALPNIEDRELFGLCCGNFLFPDCRYEVALVCYGEAGRGKSTVAEPVTAVLGVDLVARLSMSQICDPRSYHLPKLKFAAVNLGTELDVIAIDESANFKTLVSGEPVEARPIYGEPFTMQTACKLWFLANGLPRFKNGTAAELRRTRFLRFDCAPQIKDVTLKSRLQAERDGVFNFMIEGLQRLMTLPEIPLGGPESRAVHERFQASNDPLGCFVSRHCILDPDSREPKETIGNAFRSFCESNGIPADFGDWFFRKLYERFTTLKDGRERRGEDRIRVVEGVRLKNRLEIDL